MGATYQRTHPWITFSLQGLREPLPELWAMLGECQSKCEHIAGVPLPPKVAQELHRLYLAKGVLGTTAIEGNTLSEQEVLDHLGGQLSLPPSREYLAQEIDNIVRGCKLIHGRVMDGSPFAINAENCELLNAIVLDKLQLAPDVLPGRIRSHSVGVFKYRGAPAEDCRQLLDRLGTWLEGEDFQGPATLTVSFAIIRAIVAHLYLAWIHPFGDGNGRTARLVEFQILFSCGVPTSVAHLLSNHYNQTRGEYYRQLAYASESGGDIVRFIRYAVEGLLDGLRMQLKEIGKAQHEITWRDYVHEQFQDRKSATHRRRRDLVLALSSVSEPVKFSKLPDLSRNCMLAYHAKTRMTLQRDVNELLEMELIVRGSEGYSANKQIIEAFLPVKAGMEELSAD